MSALPGLLVQCQFWHPPSPCQGTQLTFSGSAVGSGLSSFASPTPRRPVYSLKQEEALQLHAAAPYIPLMTSKGAGLGNNQLPGSALH